MILDKIVEDKKIRLVEHKSRISMTEMRKMAEKCEAHPASFYEGLCKTGNLHYRRIQKGFTKSREYQQSD